VRDLYCQGLYYTCIVACDGRAAIKMALRDARSVSLYTAFCTSEPLYLTIGVECGEGRGEGVRVPPPHFLKWGYSTHIQYAISVCTYGIIFEEKSTENAPFCKQNFKNFLRPATRIVRTVFCTPHFSAESYAPVSHQFSTLFYSLPNIRGILTNSDLYQSKQLVISRKRYRIRIQTL